MEPELGIQLREGETCQALLRPLLGMAQGLARLERLRRLAGSCQICYNFAGELDMAVCVSEDGRYHLDLVRTPVLQPKGKHRWVIYRDFLTAADPG